MQNSQKKERFFGLLKKKYYICNPINCKTKVKNQDIINSQT